MVDFSSEAGLFFSQGRNLRLKIFQLADPRLGRKRIFPQLAQLSLANSQHSFSLFVKISAQKQAFVQKS